MNFQQNMYTLLVTVSLSYLIFSSILIFSYQKKFTNNYELQVPVVQSFIYLFSLLELLLLKPHHGMSDQHQPIGKV